MTGAPLESHYRIIGMTCAGCAQRVRQAMCGVPGVEDAQIDLMRGTARVVGEEAPREAVIAAVRDAGYDAERMAPASGGLDAAADDRAGREDLRRNRQTLIQVLMFVPPILLLEHARHWLWPAAAHSQVGVRLLQIALLVMMGISPAGAPILAGGLRALFRRTGNMELLITMAVVVAFASSLYGILVADNDAFIHIHAAAMILGLVCVGRYLETRAKLRATEALRALAARSTGTATVRRDGQWVEVRPEQVARGDELRAPTDTTVAADGEIIEGSAALDESLMTGEPIPVRRGPGDNVLGGSVVTEGLITVRVTAVGAVSAIGRIAQLVARAQAGKSRMQRLADRVAAVFTPIVLAAAVVTLAGWRVAGGPEAWADGVRAAVAVLVVACPCALGLATPAVVAVATGTAALRGILVREPAMLEAMGRVDTVVWDKTGTLTRGRPEVRAVHALDGADEGKVLQLAASAESLSTHPLARAIVEYARAAGVATFEADSFEVNPGRGVSCSVDGKPVLVGSIDFLSEQGVNVSLSPRGAAPGNSARVCGAGDQPAPPSGGRDAGCGVTAAMQDPGATGVGVAASNRLIGFITLADGVRPTAAEAVDRLRKLGVRSELLTGDNESTGRQVCEELGLAEFLAGARPEDKVRRVESLRASGRTVAMVGDGVNDAAAQAAADVGVAFGTGSALAGEAAGIHLIGANPHLVPDAVVLARSSVRLVRQNLFWAFFYNVLMIPLAALGVLPPAVAAAAMTVSSLTVVLNALRLRRVAGRAMRT